MVSYMSRLMRTEGATQFYLLCVYSAVKCGQKNVIFEV